MTVPDELAEIHAWWAGRSGTPEPVVRVAGSAHDQRTPPTAQNPYWDLVRQLPAVRAGGELAPDGFARGLPVGRHLLTRRYAWAIPSPADLSWLTATLDGRPLVELGAGTGYWSWQAEQAGLDVIAYEPADPATNPYVDGSEYVSLRPEDHRAVERHPDRAMLLCWPSHGAPWAAAAVEAYRGDLIVYVGEGKAGDCADDRFFELLDRDWTGIGVSPHHLPWWGTRCTMTAYRRRFKV